MASVEALGALLAGPGDWDEYRKARGPLAADLTLADLRGADLQGRTVSGCDLTGSDLTGANLDGTELSGCKISGTCFDSASFVGCALSGLHGNGPSFAGCIFRDTAVTSARLSEADFRRSRLTHVTVGTSQFLRPVLDLAEFRDVTLTGTRLSDSAGSGAKVIRCRLDDCELTACQFPQGQFLDSDFRGCAIHGVSYASSALADCRLVQCDLVNVEFSAGQVERCDFSGSKLTGVNLETVGLPSAALLRTAFVACAWPEMTGTVTLAGGYRPSPHLPRQPIQDTDGVPPLLRREIADAQFIVELLASAKNPLRRLLIRAWGITSGYGQDLTRLTGITAVIIALHSLLYLAAQKELFGRHAPDFPLLASTIGDFALASLGITPGSQPQGAGVAVITSIRVFGFIIFGIWISIAANKVSKLGSL